jgi:NACHT domain
VRIVVAVFVAISVIAAVVTIAVWLLRRRFTRERFAFYAVGSISTLAAAHLTASLSGRYVWDLAVQVIAELTGRHIEIVSPGKSELLVATIPIVILSFAAMSFFKNWPESGGRISDFDLHLQSLHDNNGLIYAAVRDLQARLGRHPTLEEEPGQHNTPTDEIYLPTDDSQWRNQALRLLTLADHSIDIPLTGWDDRAQAWFGRVRNRETLCVVAPRQAVLDVASEIALVREVAAAVPASNVEVFVVTHEDSPAKTTEIESANVTNVCRADLLRRLSKFDDYSRELLARVGSSPLPDSNLTLTDVFAPLDVRDTSGEVTDLTTSLLNWIDSPNSGHIALLGDYGQGKSSAVQVLAYRALKGEIDLGGRTPILVELRGRSPRDQSPIELLGGWAAEYGLDPRALLELNRAGKLLLIFDGFDEMSLVGDRRLRLSHFRTLWQFATPNSKLLFTGRPNFFFDNVELQTALLTDARTGSSGRPSCVVWQLEMLSKVQILQILEAYPIRVKLRIAEIIDAPRADKFVEIVSRPSVLHAAAVLSSHGQLNVGAETSSFSLVAQFVEGVYRRQADKDMRERSFMILSSAERAYFMRGVAGYMVANRLPNQITASELDRLVDDLLSEAPTAISAPSAFGPDRSVPIAKRVADDEHLLEGLRVDVRSTGLLGVDVAKAGALKFVHKSYMEFEAANLIFLALATNDPGARAALAVADVDELLSRSASQPEIVRFVSEALTAGEIRCGQLWRSYLRLLSPGAQIRTWTGFLMAVPTLGSTRRRSRGIAFRMAFSGFPVLVAMVFILKHEGVDSGVLLYVPLLLSFLVTLTTTRLGILRDGDSLGSPSFFFRVAAMSATSDSDLRRQLPFMWLVPFKRLCRFGSSIRQVNTNFI